MANVQIKVSLYAVHFITNICKIIRENLWTLIVVIFNDESSFQSPIIISITDHKVLVIYTTIVKNLLYAES